MEEYKKEILDMLINIVSKSDIKEKIEIEGTINKNQSISFNAFKNILLKITFQKTKMFIEIRNIDTFNIDEIKQKFSAVRYNNKDMYIKIDIEDVNEIKLLEDELIKVYTFLYLNEPIETYGCCSKYEECSDKKECIHTDKKFARGCLYKTNLEKGKIFYGKNRNVG